MVDPAEQAVRCYRGSWRAAAAFLHGISRVSLPWIGWRVLTAVDPPITPPLLAEMLLVVWALPGVAAWLIARAFAGRARVDTAALMVTRGPQRAVIARDRLAGARLWRAPLPEPGFALRLVGGGEAPFALAARDPTPLLAALDPAMLRHPVMVWAAARRPAPGLRYFVGRYVLFALLPAAVLFNAHQHIAYGAFLGQYYLLGLGPWLRTAAVYWATTGAYLLLWASAWRAAAEAVALCAAWAAPARAALVRNAVERVCQIAFYLGVPLLLALRFAA
jgi:apolipoprotein N-acyltransferase